MPSTLETRDIPLTHAKTIDSKNMEIENWSNGYKR
jgi:hypothetical protein